MAAEIPIDNLRAKTPFPLVPKHKKSVDILKAKQKKKQLELKAKKLMTAVKNKKKTSQPNSRIEKSKKGGRKSKCLWT